MLNCLLHCEYVRRIRHWLSNEYTNFKQLEQEGDVNDKIVFHHTQLMVAFGFALNAAKNVTSWLYNVFWQHLPLPEGALHRHVATFLETRPVAGLKFTIFGCSESRTIMGYYTFQNCSKWYSIGRSSDTNKFTRHGIIPQILN